MTITLTSEEAQQVLDALEAHADIGIRADKAIETLRARLAQPEPEPVAWRYKIGQSTGVSIKQPNMIYSTEDGGTRIDSGEPLYTAPPQREWQGLTDEEAFAIGLDAGFRSGSVRFNRLVQTIEAKLKEKNS